MKQYVYSFKEGNKDMRVILGGKGANLAEMTSIGLPVPQGFTVSTEACTAYYEDGKQISPEICAQIDNKLAELEAETGKKLGDPTNPLLVSVRSGARESMPGMMDTVLNLGLNDEVATGFTKITNNERFVYDSYRRFIQMFADVVMGFPKSSFERKFDDIKEEKGVEFDTDLTAEDLKEVVAIYKEEYKKHAGVEFPQDPKVQLMEAIKAVFRSWNNDRTPQPIATLNDVMPECYEQFCKVCDILEEHYRDMQDMEFTIENGKLFMLQTRNGKRTAQAALKIAVDLVNEGMITKEQALLKVEPRQLDQLLHPNFEETSLKCAQVVATGLAASPGAATGRIYFTAEDVIEAHKNGVQDILLVRLETSPEDIEGMNIAHGILTIRGGMTSHAAVVARGMGTCCVCGCGSLRVDEEAKVLMTPDGKKYHEGDYMSLDGSTGNVYGERIKTVEPEISGDFETFMSWADDVRTLKVRTNADTPRDALQARKFGAEGIGLCRTEHMFFEEERIFNFRRMITAETVEARKEALEKILPYQRSDFKELFKAMEIYPVTIRFLDPPLHEFLPHTDEEIRPLAESLGMTFDALKARVESLKEFNPMMGHRGCRLAVTYPEIAEMQTRAVIEAAIAVNKEGQNVVPEIMIPLVGDIKELKYVKDVVCKTADAIIEEAGVELPYKVGTMIEIPRAALTADEIAKEAEFFSFGTNDLTQMTYGFSRDDAAKFLNEYYTKNIFESDPFAHIDENGVGQLMQIAINKAKPVRPDIKLGICGEHGGDPRTVEFCHRIGLTYVSCSPYRVPLARLAAAQAAVKEKMGK